MNELFPENGGAVIIIGIILFIGILTINQFANKINKELKQAQLLLEKLSKEQKTFDIRLQEQFIHFNDHISVAMQQQEKVMPEIQLGSIHAYILEQKDIMEAINKRLKQLEKEASMPVDSGAPARGNGQPGVVPQPPVETKKFFFPFPDRQNGHFLARQARNEPGSTSVYELVLQPANPEKASFTLLHTPGAETAAINFPELYLQHACTMEGTYSITKKIERVKNGAAEKQGDYWVITEKALLRYV